MSHAAHVRVSVQECRAGQTLICDRHAEFELLHQIYTSQQERWPINATAWVLLQKLSCSDVIKLWLTCAAQTALLAGLQDS